MAFLREFPEKNSNTSLDWIHNTPTGSVAFCRLVGWFLEGLAGSLMVGVFLSFWVELFPFSYFFLLVFLLGCVEVWVPGFYHHLW